MRHGAWIEGGGARCGFSLFVLHVVRFVVAVPVVGFGLLLRAGMRHHGGLLICLTKEVVLQFFSRQDGVLPHACPSLSGR
jgi:hypothetical protein